MAIGDTFLLKAETTGFTRGRSVTTRALRSRLIPSAPASVVSAFRRKQPCDDHDGDRRHVPPKGGNYRIHEGTIGGDTRAALAANPVRSRFCSFRLQAEATVRRPRWRSATRSS